MKNVAKENIKNREVVNDDIEKRQIDYWHIGVILSRVGDQYKLSHDVSRFFHRDLSQGMYIVVDIPTHFSQLAETYKVNIEKPYFPLNTMRLFYLILTMNLTSNDRVAIDKVNRVIPKISSYLDVGDLLGPKMKLNAISYAEIHQAFDKARQEILDLIDSPTLEYHLRVTWEENHFLTQHILLKDFDEARSIPLNQIFWQLMTLRTYDHFVYAQVIGSIIREHRLTSVSYKPFDPFQNTQTAIGKAVMIMLQMNDITDAICYAKQDIASKSATLIRVVSHRLQSSQAVIEFYRDTLRQLREKIKQLALSDSALHDIHTYARLLENVLENNNP